jgi:hypothetical protein
MLRLPPIIRAPLTLVAAVLLLVGGIPVALFPFLYMDAGHYRQAVGVAAAECAHDPIPARGGCWSAASARVTITGVDHTDSGDLAYLVLQIPGRQPVRENLVDTRQAVGMEVGTAVTVRYWGDAIAQVLPPVDKSRPQLVAPTRDNPSYRAAHFPGGSAVAAVLGVVGLALFGVPLIGDARRWRRRRELDRQLEQATRDAAARPDFAQGLRRYGMSLHPEDPAP